MSPLQSLENVPTTIIPSLDMPNTNQDNTATPQISLYALVGNAVIETLRVNGTINKIIVLIDAKKHPFRLR